MLFRSKYQIEHVMPQSIDASPEWQAMLGDNWEDVHERLCNTLGNLTLTGYNQEYSNRPFQDKLMLKPGDQREGGPDRDRPPPEALGRRADARGGMR